MTTTNQPSDAAMHAIAETLCTERCAQAGDPPCSKVDTGPHCDECLGMAQAVIDRHLTPSEPVAPLGCHDCGRAYGGLGWIEAVIPHETWAMISPSGDEGGILCIQCMATRLDRLQIENVSVKLTSGPMIATDATPPDKVNSDAGLELAEAIYREIEHGDEEHRAWLRDALKRSPALSAIPTPAVNAELVEALTPSGATKAAYHGEFSFSLRRFDEFGEEYSEKVYVPWTTVKEIMAAIRERAALSRAKGVAA